MSDKDYRDAVTGQFVTAEEAEASPATTVGEKRTPRQATMPTVGRVVHYTSYGTPGGEYASECRAAIVTEVGEDSEVVGLCVLNPTGQFFNRAVMHDEDRNGGTWHWPCVRA